jgi:Flp pilus assembly protein TadD
MRLDLFSGLPDAKDRRTRMAGEAEEIKKRARETFDPAEIWKWHGIAESANLVDPWVDYTMARVFYENGKTEEALKLFRKAHGKAPNLPDVRLALCFEAIQQNRLDDAEEHLRMVERFRPREEMVPKLNGEILCRRGDFAGAIPHFKRDLERNPKDPFVWSNLGMAQDKTGRFREAMASYRRGLELAPNDAQMQSDLGRLLALRGKGQSDQNEAVTLARRAVEAAPDSVQYRANLAVVYARAGLSGAAEAEAARVAEMAAEKGNVEVVGRMRGEMKEAAGRK